ncbi:MAG: hypothetical protein R3D70_12350 [Rhizobiaceae bacterium]
MLFDAARPVILNGIEDIVTRPDLADRAVFLTLEPIPGCDADRRRSCGRRSRQNAHILGVLLDAVVEGLKLASRYSSAQAAAHGRLRAVGFGLRNRDLACGHILVCLLRKPRRGR